MDHNKPLPLKSPTAPGNCPVCGQVSYSRAGVHPQCSAKQADASRVEKLKQAKPKAAAAKKISQPTRWQKSCPECKTSQHVRKATCECGFVFAAKTGTQPDFSDTDD